MLANIITLADNMSATHSFDLVSRSGMTSVRRESGVASSLNSALTIKNTVDLNSPSKPNRHLIKFSKLIDTSSTGGVGYEEVSIHAVISRGKNVPDETVFAFAGLLGAFLTEAHTSVSDALTDIMVGGN